ncbi:MAG: hypothetical protein OXG97_05030 [Candidatus Poribacteria bacterium]|nr:hypothetical protein [Candidatus Poribacteria bacterium]
MKADGCVESKGFNLDTDVLAAKETGCTGILALRMFGMAIMAMRMFVMIMCQSDDTEQQDIAT